MFAIYYRHKLITVNYGVKRILCLKLFFRMSMRVGVKIFYKIAVLYYFTNSCRQLNLLVIRHLTINFNIWSSWKINLGFILWLLDICLEGKSSDSYPIHTPLSPGWWRHSLSTCRAPRPGTVDGPDSDLGATSEAAIGQHATGAVQSRLRPGFQLPVTLEAVQGGREVTWRWLWLEFFKKATPSFGRQYYPFYSFFTTTFPHFSPQRPPFLCCRSSHPRAQRMNTSASGDCHVVAGDSKWMADGIQFNNFHSKSIVFSFRSVGWIL